MQPIFQQKFKVMKQKADVADTLTIIIKVLRYSYTATQQFCHWIVEKMQIHKDKGENTLKRDWRLHNCMELEA